MTRIYHPWNVWECYKANFYGGVRDDYPRDNTHQLYADFLKDPVKFETALKEVVATWTYSCEHNLTNVAMNRVAWMGQAAMALTYGTPHNQTMGGYNLLSDAEKAAADALAQKYIDLWEASRNVYSEAV